MNYEDDDRLEDLGPPFGQVTRRELRAALAQRAVNHPIPPPLNLTMREADRALVEGLWDLPPEERLPVVLRWRSESRRVDIAYEDIADWNSGGVRVAASHPHVALGDHQTERAMPSAYDMSTGTWRYFTTRVAVDDELRRLYPPRDGATATIAIHRIGTSRPTVPHSHRRPG